MNVKTWMRWLSFATLMLSIAWVYFEPKFDSWMAFASALVVFVGSLALSEKAKRDQVQTVSGGSNAVQAGGDVSFGGSVDREKS